MLIVELFDVEQDGVGALGDADELIELDLDRFASRFWVFWIRNTIRKVMMVVLVLMISCQVSLNLKIGPVAAQTTITASASMKVAGLPLRRAAAFAKRLNQDFLFMPTTSAPDCA